MCNVCNVHLSVCMYACLRMYLYRFCSHFPLQLLIHMPFAAEKIGESLIPQNWMIYCENDPTTCAMVKTCHDGNPYAVMPMTKKSQKCCYDHLPIWHNMAIDRLMLAWRMKSDRNLCTGVAAHFLEDAATSCALS